jgi:hypothetical protein
MKEDDAKEKCIASDDVKKRFNFRECDAVNAAVHVVFGKYDSSARFDFSSRTFTKFSIL